MCVHKEAFVWSRLSWNGALKVIFKQCTSCALIVKKVEEIK